MVNSIGIRWDVPPSTLAAQVEAWGKRLIQAIHDLGRFFAARIEGWAKQNARWTDRTGNARQGLTARAVEMATGVVIVLFHQAAYGIWLEVAHAGRWGIIIDALRTHYPEVMRSLQRLAS